MTEKDEIMEQVRDIMERAQGPEGEQLAQAALERYRNDPAIQGADLKEHDIMKVLKMSYIAERFFGRSRSWLCHKLNHDMMNGKPAALTADEQARLKDALETIASELQELADSM